MDPVASAAFHSGNTKRPPRLESPGVESVRVVAWSDDVLEIVRRLDVLALDAQEALADREPVATQGFVADAEDTSTLLPNARLEEWRVVHPFSTPVRGGDGWMETATLRVEVVPDPLRITVRRRTADGWHTLVEDRVGGAWLRNDHAAPPSEVWKHYQHIEAGTRHYGLGDTTGPIDRTGRRVRMLQLDALGYDAEHSDPLYKHAPFLIAEHDGGTVGLLYDTLAETTFDLGCEHSNYFRPYRHVTLQDEAVRLVVMAGERVRDVVPTFYGLTGRTFVPPPWALGFAYTSMHHADAEDGPDVIANFGREARARALPISAIHFGSGYAKSDEGQRLTFEWNRRRYPDPPDLFATLSAMGFRTVANLKPVLHEMHPAYAEAARQRLFVGKPVFEERTHEVVDEETGVIDVYMSNEEIGFAPAVEPFWDGRGAQLDFTNTRTVDWWRSQVRTSILGQGFDACWNDNNEAELADGEAEVARGRDTATGPIQAVTVRPLHALHMARASYEEMLETDPRPHNITRAGPIGICRYAETWTGDNVTSWHTLKWNLRQGLSMSLSGFPLVGHDVGGFVGPSPGPELLVRWFQMMALHPRCVMNSWKPETGVPNLPWMHEDVFEHVVAALTLRYRFLPVLEREIRRAHEEGEPVIAPILYHCDDAQAREDMDGFMLGRDVLVLPVVEKGGREGRGWLPSGADWIDFHTDERHAGGAFTSVPAPLERLPLLVRAGATLRLASEWPNHAPHDATAFEERTF